jgi:hypothetical protein
MNARTLASLALLLAADCGLDNFSSVQLFEICFPPAPDASGNCIYPPKCENTLLGRPLADLAPGRATGLLVPVQVNNQLKSNATATTPNTNDAHIEKYTITYDDPFAPGKVLLANDTIPAAGNTVVLIDVLPSATGTFAAGTVPTIVAKVVASGRYDDGTTFQTGPFKIAFDVCSGCLGFAACTGTKVFQGGCPGSAVTSTGTVVAIPVNPLCQ